MNERRFNHMRCARHSGNHQTKLTNLVHVEVKITLPWRASTLVPGLYLSFRLSAEAAHC